MTIGITVAGAAFTKTIGSNAFPFFKDALFAYYHGPNAASSQKNYVVGSDDPTAALIGAPTYGPNYATIGVNDGYNTGVDYFGPFTYITVIDGGAGNRSVIGNYASGDSRNAMLLVNAKSLDVQIDNQVRTTGVDISHTGASSDEFVLVGASYGANTVRAFHKSDSTFLETSSTYARTAVANPSVRVGGIFLGDVNYKVAAAVGYKRVLSQTEIEKVHGVLKANLAKRGITLK